MKRLATFVAAAVMALSAGIISAYADDCAGHSHDTGTALGAGGGALIGGLVSHSVVGGVAGGFAGNAIARSGDCDHRAHLRPRASYNDRIYHDGHGDIPSTATATAIIADPV